MPLKAEHNQRYRTLVLKYCVTFYMTVTVPTFILRGSSLHIGVGFAVDIGHKEKQTEF